MGNIIYQYDKSDPLSIYEYSDGLIEHTLFELFGQAAIDAFGNSSNKGELGQNVEELFFGYKKNSISGPDFQEANLELKCTGVTKYVKTGNWRIKERLVCGDINYFSVVNDTFESSSFYLKCRLMLLLFYLYEKGAKNYDLKFVIRILWQLPESDLKIIKDDYDKIVKWVKDGKAHELTEGLTTYLAACRGGGASTNDQSQPYSTEKAKLRRFSLKPAYMRTVIANLTKEEHFYTNYNKEKVGELFTYEQLKKSTFDDLVIEQILNFKGLDYVQLCNKLHATKTNAKQKYALITNKIVSPKIPLKDVEEYKKAGFTIKTIRLNTIGQPDEAMSFKNIDYQEVFENDIWEESDCYDLFSGRFLFVVFKEVPNESIRYRYFDKKLKRNKIRVENRYVLTDAFYWIMSQEDLDVAETYWKDMRKSVIANEIDLQHFWRENPEPDAEFPEAKYFHVRPKGATGNYKGKAINPHGGNADKYCYWFNHDYVHNLINQHYNHRDNNT